MPASRSLMICGENNSVSEEAMASSSVFSRKQSRQRNDVVAVEAEPVGQLEPARDPAFVFALAIMVDQAPPPLPAQVGLVTARDQARVLARDHRLVIVPIECPRLNLALRALTAVQQHMKRVQAVIPACADVAQLRPELG